VPATVLAGALAAVPAASWAQDLRIPKADVQYDQAADFSAFHTYAWKDTQERLPNPTRHIAVVTAIERELEKKGLVKARDGAADVEVRFYATLDKHVSGSARQSETPALGVSDLRITVDVEKMAEGTLVVELYEPKTDRRLWRGTTTRVLRESAIDEEAIRSAVALVLRSYPPSPPPRP